MRFAEREVSVLTLLSEVTEVGSGSIAKPKSVERTYQVTGSTISGDGAAVVKIQVSNDGVNWVDLATFDLSLSTSVVSEGASSEAPWLYTRATISEINGSGASISVVMGVL